MSEVRRCGWMCGVEVGVEVGGVEVVAEELRCWCEGLVRSELR
jgi:hypothetical protein